MAKLSYLKLTGSKQGVIKGDVLAKGYEQSIEIHAFHQLTISPATAIGAAAGKVEMKPVFLTKPVDKSSVPLLNALMLGEVFTKFELITLLKPGSNTQQIIYTITLTNARIVGIETIKPDTENTETATLNEYEEIGFSFEKIEWAYLPGNLVATGTVH